MKNISVSVVQFSRYIREPFLFLLFGLLLQGPVLAQNYETIDIRPQNVGIFTEIGDEQFTAYGITASGQRDDITDEVDWYLTEYSFTNQALGPNALACIDQTGYLTLNEGITWGRASVRACYPKGCSRGQIRNCGVTISNFLGIILKPKFAVSSSVDGTDSSGTVVPEGEILVRRGNKQIYDLTSSDNTYEASAVTAAADVDAPPLCAGGSFKVDRSQYTTGPVVEDCSLVFHFTKSPVATSSVDPADLSLGTVDPLGAIPVVTGQGKTFDMQPIVGHEIISVTADGVTPLCAGNFTPDYSQYTTDPVAGDCSLVFHITAMPVLTVNMVNNGGGGIVTGIDNCSTPILPGTTVCTGSFQSNTPVNLEAIVQIGETIIGTFDGWTDDCIGCADSNKCIVNVGTAGKTCTASFTAPPLP